MSRSEAWRRRIEDPPLLAGRGSFLDDLEVPGALHAAFVRSPHAHARILRIDVAPAVRAPGVHLVLAGRDLATRMPTRIATPGYLHVERTLLPTDRVRFVGEPIALVVADDAYLARDAAELVEADFEPLPAHPDEASALADGATLLHDGAAGNLLFDRAFESAPDVDAAFASAAVVIRVGIRHPRVTGLAIENRGAVAAPSRDGSVTVWSSTQSPHTLKTAICDCLGLAPERVRVVVPDVGGGFGAKAQIYPEEIAVAAAAIRLGRPVKWTEDRLENLAAASHARDTSVDAEVAASADGVITAIRADVACAAGAFGVHPYGPILEPMGTATMIPGPYVVAAYRYRARAVATNASPVGAYRGVGMVTATLVHERLIDELARELDLDPAEVRRRNLIPSDAFPYQSPAGHQYDSGAPRECLERALELAEYDGLRNEQRRARSDGRLTGIGIACYTEYTGMGSATFRGRGMLSVPGPESAWLRLDADGGFTVSMSQPALGQGLHTTVARALAAELGVSAEQVRVLRADTARARQGTGTFASRGAVAGLGALRAASGALRQSLLPLCAELLEADPADVEWVAGGAALRGAPDRRATFGQLAAATTMRGETACEVSGTYDPPTAAFSFAAHVAVVEIDSETGEVAIVRYVVVEDCGPRLEPAIVEGQLHGAAAQGIGGALFEELVYDQSGQLVTSTLMDYLAPCATDVPTFLLDHRETPSPLTPGGHKGVGEGGTIGATAAVANAVADALAPLGVRICRLPLSPDRVRALIRSADPVQ